MAKFVAAVILVVLTLSGCAPASSPTFAVQTTALTDAGLLRAEFGAPPGGNASVRSFPLTWTNLPAGTKALALTLLDRDYDNFVHWLAADIDPATGGLKDNGSLDGLFPQGVNDTGGYGYFGPLPPEKHVYVLTVYALSEPTGLEPRFLLEDLQEALKGRVLGTATLDLPYDPLVK